MKTATYEKIFDQGIFGFWKILMRGAAQVMFQRSVWTGVLFMVGIFWGAYSGGNSSVAWGALLGLVVSTATGFILDMDAEQGVEGLWGFNGILVGCAFPTFMQANVWMWLALALCAAFTTWAREGLNKIMQQWKINSFTFPFVLCTWLFLLSALQMQQLDTHHHISAHHHTLHHLDLVAAIECWLRGVSQVFLIDSWLTGAILLIALAIGNCRAAIWGAIGSALSSATALVMGAPTHEVAQGLYGFSATLTAIALATVFYRPGWRSALWATLGILITSFVQAAMNSALAPVGIPTLTWPFCLTTWLFLLPMLKLDDRQPDHSRWHTSTKSE